MNRRVENSDTGRLECFVHPAIYVTAFLLCWGSFVTYYQLKFGLNVPPATSGDEVDYDSLAWELSLGNGFRIDTGNTEFRQPYELAAQESERFQLGPPLQQIVTYRPPLFPFVMSQLNRVVGRQFWAIRMLDAAFMAGTLVMILWAFLACWREEVNSTEDPQAISCSPGRVYEWSAMIFAVALFIGLDVRTRLYGRAILTEAISLFLTSIICVVLLRNIQLLRAGDSVSRLRFMMLGVLFGVSLLARTLIVLWLPGMLILLYWLTRRFHSTGKQALLQVLLFAVGMLVVVAPWGVRNIRVTGEWMPLGTQGLVQLSAAFGDEVWESGGNWINLETRGFFENVIDPEQTPLENEIAKAKWSKSRAIEWIKMNPGQALALVPMKIVNECRPQNVVDWGILILLFIGVVSRRRSSMVHALLAMIAMNLFAIGITWSVDAGRFLVPVLLPIHVLAVIGFASLLQHVGSYWSTPDVQR